MAYGPRNVRVEYTAPHLTHFAGILLLHQCLQALNLRHQGTRAFRWSHGNRTYSPGELLLALIYPLLLGVGRIETWRLLQRNGAFRFLSGLAHFPDPTTLRRFLDAVGTEGLATLLGLHDALRAWALARVRPYRTAVLDFDSTVLPVYTLRGGARIGFNPTKRGRPSYQPLLRTEGTFGDCLGAQFLPGNADPPAMTAALLEQVWPLLPATVERVWVRADGAWDDHKILQVLRGKSAAFVINAMITAPLQLRLPGLRYHRVSQRSAVEVAEFRYQPLKWPQAERFIAVRQPVSAAPSWQLTLFQVKGYTYRAFVTDLPHRPVFVWRFYNHRAHIEQLLREWKHAYRLGKMPTRSWAGNEAYLHLVLLSYNLLLWLQRECAPPAWQRMGLERFRQRVLWTAGSLTRPRGVPTLRLPRAFPDGREFEMMLRKARHVRGPWT